jgi:phosphoenolpyruvate synthase/pyruvate phosphate dikinase
MFLRTDSTIDPALATKEHLGGKGYGLHVMTKAGVNVPPALIFPTTLCVDYQKKPKTVMKDIAKQIPAIIEYFTAKMGYMPLLSVRSGARVSMPGMMDTILNVGLTTSTRSFWSKKLGIGCVTDCQLRLSEMYGSTVLGLSKDDIHRGINEGSESFVPDDLKAQLLGCIEAVFKSWDNDRAVFYRKLHKIPGEWGTAVVVQAMVFGNLNDHSGTGVLFTRNPDTGENLISGEFLINAQGEDVVAGVRTPMNLKEMPQWNAAVAAELSAAVTKLEQVNKDCQDVEFTIQDGVLYILQTRSAKRSAPAAVKMAVDMVKEGLIDHATACQRVSLRDLDLMMLPVLQPGYDVPSIASGIPACSGVVTGKPVFSSKDAINCKVPCILITEETTPDDIEGMHAAVGVITMTGGSTSHAAVVARGMNKPCVVGVGAELSKFSGDVVSFDGVSGKIWLHTIPVVDNSSSPALQEFKAMIRKGLAYIPVLDIEPVEKLPAGLIEYRTLVGKTDKQVGQVLRAMMKKTDHLYVDIRQGHAIEKAFFSIFEPVVETEQKAAAAVQAALAFIGYEYDENKVSLVVSSGVNTPLAIVPTTDDLESVIMASGAMGVMVSDKPAMKKVLEWKKAEGLKLMAFGDHQPGIASVLADHQAHRLLVG